MKDYTLRDRGSLLFLLGERREEPLLATRRTERNLVPRAHVSFGQRRDTELWNNPFQETEETRRDQDFGTSGFTAHACLDLKHGV